MRQVREYEGFDESESELLTGDEAEELDAAIAEADASKPEDWVEFGEFMRRLRNGE